MDRALIIETVNRFFISVDEKDWKMVRSILQDTVFLDYASMGGGDPSLLKADQIIESWKGLLPGFDKTHHQLGNWLIENESGSAKAFCYGTATHYLENETNNNIWTVVGSYDIKLKLEDANWRIGYLQFNLKYTDGNNDLPKMAKARLKV
jgi:hypothetical protein